jgi:hypothetical protein
MSRECLRWGEGDKAGHFFHRPSVQIRSDRKFDFRSMRPSVAAPDQATAYRDAPPMW